MMPGLVQAGELVAGKYRVDRVLGVGGMGMVVAATHVELDQPVALKLMLPDAMSSAQAVERFLREARAAARLRGEHVCRVLDVGRCDDDTPYIVMELLDGEDLAQRLARRGALPVDEAVDLVLQALLGLAEAHAAGIVHRDLKPGNLFVTETADGAPLVKVLDFGISKWRDGGGPTRTGELMGSPAYMAPEHMTSSKDVDERADLWAIGVILYQLVSGRLPFEYDSLAALCAAVMSEPAPRLDAVAPAPPALADVVARCLAKPRDERPADATSLARALAPFGGPGAAALAARIARLQGGRAARDSSAPPPEAPRALGHLSTVAAAPAPPAEPARVPPRRRGVRLAAAVGAAGALALGLGLAAHLGLRGPGRPAAHDEAAAPRVDAGAIAADPDASPSARAAITPDAGVPALDASVRDADTSTTTAPPPARAASRPGRRATSTAPPPADDAPAPASPQDAGPSTGRPTFRGTPGTIITDYPGPTETPAERAPPPAP